MSELGTCDTLQDVRHPYSPLECVHWQPCEPVASPQATRPCAHRNQQGHEWETWCMDCGQRWPNLNPADYTTTVKLPAAQPAAGTTPAEKQQKLRDDVDKIINPELSEATTPQAERPENWADTWPGYEGCKCGHYHCDHGGQEDSCGVLGCKCDTFRAVAPVETPEEDLT